MTSHFTGTTKKTEDGVTESSVRRGASSDDCENRAARVQRQTVPNMCGSDRKSTIADGRQPRTADNQWWITVRLLCATVRACCCMPCCPAPLSFLFHILLTVLV